MSTKEKLQDHLENRCGKPLAQCSRAELYTALLDFTKAEMEGIAPNTGKKKLYYLSMEFLIGRLLTCNLINLGLYGEVDALLRENGLSLAALEECEPEPSLGNGGLGRLASCYLDSAATLGLPAAGVGLCYHFGLFRQEFVHNLQVARKNPWIEADSWLTETGRSYQVDFGSCSVRGKLLEVCVPGYGSGSGALHLFDLETVDESLVKEGIDFDKTAVDKNLTLFLYPDDSDEAGRLLRVYQEYFLASCAAQLILEEAEARGAKPAELAEVAVVQINDTHPSLIIPELVRLLGKKGLSMDEAIETVSGLCAYTNHTILAEALEKWPLAAIETVAPQLVPILLELDARAKEKFSNKAVAIIDRKNIVHMAHLDIHYGFSVNGVAALHTEILEKSELAPFYKIYPQKFNNKTNGVTFRRWLMACNPALSAWVEGLIGPGFKKNAEALENLLDYRKDNKALKELLTIKQAAKEDLAGWLAGNTGIRPDTASVFDIQIKRLHEYKRQQLNALWIIRQILRIREGWRPKRPITCIFGAKAAPAYVIAQDIIHLILCLQQYIEGEPEVRKWLRVIMVENYNVSAAERLIPACDISEQISLASKEASGTGNMKFMLNGAVTLGTMDGANVEISQLVGKAGKGNIYIFGRSSKEVIALYKKGSYDPLPYYQQDEPGRLLDFIVSQRMLSIGSRESLARLHRELIAKDWFMTLPDAADYFRVKDTMLEDYENRDAWAEKMLVNIAMAGFFSSDRSVAEYSRDIWHLQ